MAALPADCGFDTLLPHIHRAGCITLPESIFFETMLGSITAQAQQVAQMHEKFMAGSALAGK